MTNPDDTSTVVTTEQTHLVADGKCYASLVMLHGRQMGLSIPLNKEVMVIGRSNDCDILIDDENVSRRHAEISVSDGKVCLRDLDSTNGTYVNSRHIRKAILEDGDLLMISSTVLKFLCSSSIENRFFDQMYSMVTTDFRTKLYNHRYLMNRLAEEFSRAKRHERPLSLLIYDIDNFKTINDSFGHPAGDQLLAGSARLVSSQLRQDDVFARFGGDEFCLLCPETTLRQALILAERIRSFIKKTNFTYKDWKLEVSLSIGVAEFLADMSSPEQLIAKTDEALYRAKQSGKNQICS